MFGFVNRWSVCEYFFIYSFLVGALTASFMFCQFICSPLWGWYSDLHGRRMALIIGQVLSIIHACFGNDKHCNNFNIFRFLVPQPSYFLAVQPIMPWLSVLDVLEVL